MENETNTNAVETLLAAIKNRRSRGVARLRPDSVPQALIAQALDAADWAPSHGETEPWRFVVYTGAARIALGEAFAEAYRRDAEADGDFKQSSFDAQRERTHNVPVWISIGMQPATDASGAMKMTVEEEQMAVACAVQNLHLVACAEGLAGMWLSKGVFRDPGVARFVGLTEPHGRLLGFFVLGFPANPAPNGERRPLHEKVRWVD
ncbi:MAG: nitroreductase [Armatimonadetes bacterium]|nr:nitroreductase [Armatimonadota bacterium]